MSFSINLNYPAQIDSIIHTQNFTQQNTILNYIDVASSFCNIYYTGMMTNGLSTLLYLFDQNAQCNYNGKDFIGMYNVLASFTTDHIAKLVYDKLNYTPVVIDKNILLIQVSGTCYAVTFWKQFTTLHSFTESFILKCDNVGKIIVTSYIFKII